MTQTPQGRDTEFFSVKLTAPARDALRQTSLRLSLMTGRRISMSDALVAILNGADIETAASHLATK